MNYTLLAEQFFNGFQLGIILFLVAAGLTLIFGIMDLVNLAHGTLYMFGAFFAATFIKSGVSKSGSPKLRGITLCPFSFNSLLILAMANVADSDNLFNLSETFVILVFCFQLTNILIFYVVK